MNRHEIHETDGHCYIEIKGQQVLFDKADCDLVAPYAWYIKSSSSGKDFYVVRYQSRIGMGMARHLLNAPDGMLVDHINHQTLDNRRENLRLCTHAENMRNKQKICGTSKYKGVYLKRETGRWRANISLNNKRMDLGTFDNEDEAALAYNIAANTHYGEFACLNIINGASQ